MCHSEGPCCEVYVSKQMTARLNDHESSTQLGA